MTFAEVYAFENIDLTTDCKPPTLTDISVSDGLLDSIINTTDNSKSAYNRCV